MQTIPLKPLKSQQLKFKIREQECAISIYQKSTGLYFDLQVDGTNVTLGVLARNRTLLVRQPYLGFVGDLVFVDTTGSEDPVYTGLGDRFDLVYLEPSP